MGGKSSKAKISRYNMSLHYGICHGPVDAVEAIYAGEKLAWEGPATDNTTFVLNKEGLFGGITKEGGINGTVELMFGGTNQQVSPALAHRLGDTPDRLPGFRGFLSAFFRGTGSNPAGFYWAASNPYLKSIWFTIRSIPRDLGGPYAAVPREAGGPAVDANPAHIIYTCYVNTDWGMGEDPNSIDTESFLAAAETLYNEYLGLSLQWTQSGTIEDFVNNILDHINGAVFTHPRTGKFTLRLVRNDYDVDTIRVINPDNATLTNFARKSWGETSNEMKVTWTNPTNEQEETVYSQDLGNIAVQGSVISDSRNYHGVRHGVLAQQLADRELRAASAPLASAEAELDNSFWDVTPYEVVKLVWPEYGIDGLIVRVTNVSYGTRSKPRIGVSLLEDVFSLPQAAFVAPPGSGWVDPAQPPIPVTGARIIPAPAYSLIQEEIPLEQLEYPSTLAAILVPSPYSSGSVSYSVDLRETTPSGGQEWVEAMDTQQFAGRGELVGAIIPEPTSVIPPPINATGPMPWVDFFLVIGPDDAPVEELELALVTSVDPVSGNLIVLRGVLDTVPKQWPAGTRVWSVPVGLFDPLPEELTEGQTIEARVITTTTLGQTDADESPVFTAVAASRATRPLRPANVRLNGEGFAPVVLDTTMVFTWSHRNRLLEDNQVLSWTAASTPLEPGVSYTVEIDAYDSSGALLQANWYVQGVGTAAAHSVDLEQDIPPAGASVLRGRVVSIRDGERSWQNYELIGELPVSRRTTTQGHTRVTTQGDRRVLARLI